MPLDTIMGFIGEPVLVIDSDYRISRVSKSFEVATGIPARDLLGPPVVELGKIAGLASVIEVTKKVFSSGETHSGTAVFSGNAYELSVKPVAENDSVAKCVCILLPPTARHPAHREGFDELTGLLNRHLFNDRVEQAINNAQRGNKSVLVILMGIDRFNEICDVVGDHAGKEILRLIAERLRQCVRSSDTVARLEGDRFAFVMQVAAIDDSVLLTEKILSAFEQPFSLDHKKDLVITCSLGAGIYPADGVSFGELIKNATVALHHAEQGGRNRCQFFSNEMNVRAHHRLEIESGIRRALSNREFLVYYQPKMDVNTQQVAGMEALVRWRHPDRGLISPGEFIPIAEESGLIEQIGQWVLEETCAQNCRWQAEGLPPMKASVNVAARQFRNRNFVATVEEVLARTGLAPCWLELEITESTLMGDIAAIVERMEDLRRIGVSLSIDDFGTGYSSLSYLSRFPITTLKIDRAFITDLQTNPHIAEIARAIIGLSHGLKLEVVAEGAEAKEQVEFLREHGCNLIQGFFYSKPLPADEFGALLRAYRISPD